MYSLHDTLFKFRGEQFMFHKLQNVLPPWTPHSPEGERNNYFETSEKSHLATRLHMPEELNRHRQWGEGLKNRFFL
jgi:hypothetical protein